jgi:hypothetical protein
MPKQKPGQLAGKMKWHVARYPRPVGELIFLGSILKDPEDPESSLNRKTRPATIPKEDRIDDTASVRQHITTELSNGSGALLKIVAPISPLLGAGLKAEGSSNDAVSTFVDAINVKAEICLPEKSFVDEALAKPEVVKYAKTGAWAKSLYMIVGVATAGSLAISEEQSHEVSAGINANAAMAGTGTEFEGDLSGKSNATGTSKLETGNATDFAYRVREFNYSKFRVSGKWKDKGDYIEGAMFGKDESNHTESGVEDFVPVFEDWDDDDYMGTGSSIYQNH